MVSIYYAGILFVSEVYVNKIYHAMNANNQKKVIEFTDKALTKFTTVDFKAMPILNYRGVANLRMKKYKQADKDLLSALTYFPNHIGVLSNLAIVSAEMNNSEKAIKYLERSLELYPNYEDALYNMVKIYYKNKDYQKAYLMLLRCNTQTAHRYYDGYMMALMNMIDKNSKKAAPK